MKTKTPGALHRAFVCGDRLKPFEKVTRRARDVHAARRSALPVFDTLDNARRLAALGAVGTLGGVHRFLAITRLGNLRHDVFLSAAPSMRL